MIPSLRKNIYKNIIETEYYKYDNLYKKTLNNIDIELKGSFLYIESLKDFVENKYLIDKNISNISIKYYDINPPEHFFSGNILFIMIFCLKIPLQKYYLPCNLIRIHILNCYNNLCIDSFPDNLKKISLFFFNSSLDNILPYNLEELLLSFDNNIIIDNINIPKSVKKLTLVGKYNKKLPIHFFPDNLEELEMNGNFNPIYFFSFFPEKNLMRFPKNITKLILNKYNYILLLPYLRDLFPVLKHLKIDSIHHIKYNDSLFPKSLLTFECAEYINFDNIENSVLNHNIQIIIHVSNEAKAPVYYVDSSLFYGVLTKENAMNLSKQSVDKENTKYNRNYNIIIKYRKNYYYFLFNKLYIVDYYLHNYIQYIIGNISNNLFGLFILEELMKKILHPNRLELNKFLL